MPRTGVDPMNATITIDSDPTGETRIVGMEFDDLDREDVRNKLTDFWRGFTSCNCHVKFADECRTCGQRDSHRDGCPNAKQIAPPIPRISWSNVTWFAVTGVRTKSQVNKIEMCRTTCLA